MLKIITRGLLLLMIASALQAGTTPTLKNTTKLYVATFNRAPDASGLSYWANNAGLSLEGIAQSFFDQSETQKAYPADSTNADFIEAVYQNLFNRAAEADGLVYWVEELDSGRIAKSTFILAVINGAQDTEEFGNDATILTNKTRVGLSFANAGLNDITDAREIMLGVNDDEGTVISALEAYGIEETIGDTSTKTTLSYMRTNPNDKLASTDCRAYLGGGETVSLVWVGGTLETPIVEGQNSWSDVLSALGSYLAPADNMYKSISECKWIQTAVEYSDMNYDTAVEAVNRNYPGVFSDSPGADTTTTSSPNVDDIAQQQNNFEAYSAEIESNTVTTCKEKYGNYTFTQLVTFSNIPTAVDESFGQIMNGDASYCFTLLLQSGDLSY